MILMNMNLANKESIIIQKIFLATKALPLAIQMDPANNKHYKVLFKLTESISNSDIFFEVRLIAEDNLDRAYIESRSIYIDNIMKDPKKEQAFKEIMKDYDIEKFYIGDLNFNFNNQDINYYVDGYKQLGDNNNNVYFETIKIYITRSLFISMSLYIQDLMDIYNKQEKEFVFISSRLNNLRFEKVEDVKLLATTKKELDDGNYSYNSAYELNCGPTSWKFNYEIITPEDLELREPLDSNIFDSEYSQYNDNFIGAVPENRGFVYIITTNDNGNVVALIVSNALIEKTNIIDPYLIFVDEYDSIIDGEQEDN